MKFAARVIVPLLSLAVLTAGCLPDLRKPTAADTIDLHERISYAMRRNGYAHEIISSRTAQGEDADTITVSISLDALKRRNRSLDAMLREIGAICRMDEYRDVQISFWFFSDDTKSAEYVEKVLNQTIGSKRSWVMEQDSKLEGELKSKLVIRFRHIAIKPNAPVKLDED